MMPIRRQKLMRSPVVLSVSAKLNKLTPEKRNELLESFTLYELEKELK